MKLLRIVLLDVTDMGGDSVCVAGMDLATRRTVRLSDRTPTRRLLRGYGGLRPGDIVVIRFDPKRRPELPHSEDGRWDHLTLRKHGALDNEELHRLLAPRALASVTEAFGPPAFRGRNGNSAWQPGRGARSLATVRATAVQAYLAGDTLRMEFIDGAGVTWKGAPFQDLSVKTHPGACSSCDSNYLRNVAAEFNADEALIRIGLTRPFAAESAKPGCWLQVSNVFSRPRRHF